VRAFSRCADELIVVGSTTDQFTRYRTYWTQTENIPWVFRRTGEKAVERRNLALVFSSKVPTRIEKE